MTVTGHCCWFAFVTSLTAASSSQLYHHDELVRLVGLKIVVEEFDQSCFQRSSNQQRRGKKRQRTLAYSKTTTIEQDTTQAFALSNSNTR